MAPIPDPQSRLVDSIPHWVRLCFGSLFTWLHSSVHLGECHLPFGVSCAQIVSFPIVATNGCVTFAICNPKLIKCSCILPTTLTNPSQSLSLFVSLSTYLPACLIETLLLSEANHKLISLLKCKDRKD